MQCRVAGNDPAGGEHVAAAFDVTDHAARFADDDDTGRHIPRVELPLPEAVEPAGGEPAKIDRRGATATYSRYMLHEMRELDDEFLVPSAAIVGNTGGDHGLVQGRALSDAEIAELAAYYESLGDGQSPPQPTDEPGGDTQ